MAGKLGEERLKEMEAEMAFEQEVLGGPVPGGPSVMEAVPMALAVPMVRPIIGTNTYQQVQQTLEARAAGFVGPPGPTFVAPPPMMRPTFVPHILQRPVSAVVTSSAPVIQAAPTVYSAPPATVVRKPERTQRQARMQEELAARVAEQQAVVMAAGLLNKKDPEESPTTMRVSRPEPEPPHIEEDKRKSKGDKLKKCIRTAAGTSWEDASLLEWDSDFRIFCGDLGNEVNDDILARAFSRYPSFLKAKKYVGSRPIKLRKSMWKDRNIEVVRKKQKEKKKLGLR
uniref:RNA binding motif protein 42 n=1 Tax=Periophthalmus magnuspinnatus TaxID=409849 RepID=A0A3B3ZK75_9GOBI